MTAVDILKIGIEQKSFPKYIYKYRSAVDDNTKKIITDNELWFADPFKFNDPYDCNTPIDTNSSKDEIRAWLNSVGVEKSKIETLVEELKLNPNYISDATKTVLSNHGVCCFSTLDDSILQWSHYSDYHKGICLKFDITADYEFFIIPVIVSYRKIMQHYNHFCHSQNIVEYLIKPKFADWSYESEIRIVKNPDQINANSNLKKRAFKFKDKALKEIIFGIQTPSTVIDEYKQLCLQNNKTHTVFSKMSLNSGTHYKLNKHTI